MLTTVLCGTWKGKKQGIGLGTRESTHQRFHDHIETMIRVVTHTHAHTQPDLTPLTTLWSAINCLLSHTTLTDNTSHSHSLPMKKGRIGCRAQAIEHATRLGTEENPQDQRCPTPPHP